MFVKSISSYSVDRFGKACKIVTDYGKFKQYNIAIEHTYIGEAEQEKLYIVWDKWMQMIVPKAKKNGKFERIG